MRASGQHYSPALAVVLVALWGAVVGQLPSYCNNDFSTPCGGSSSSDIFNGDAVILEEQMANRDKRAITAFDSFLWPNGVVKYTISPLYNEEQKATILLGLHYWENGTCVRFVESESGSHIRIYPGIGCCSYIGNLGCNKVQGVSVGFNCFNLRNVVHEVGHALGFFHEQSRPDRDDYINVLYDNILDGFESNFYKLNDIYVDSQEVGYDFNSVMHYGSTAFSKDGSNTIEAKKPGIPLGIAIVPSELDIIQLNRRYSCDLSDLPPLNIEVPTTPTPTLPPLTLPNPSCGSITDRQSNAVIVSPNYPSYPHNIDCYHIFRTEFGMSMKVRFQSWLESSSLCSKDYIQLYIDAECTIPYGSRLCGLRSITYTFNYALTEMCVRVRTDGSNSGSSSSYRGYRITYNEEDVNECSIGLGRCTHRCVNTVGSYHCECFNDSFRLSLDGNTCFDINECAIDNGGCHQKCRNGAGWYECSCNDGYVLDSDNRTCNLITSTSCQNNNGGCEHMCETSDSTSVCKCNKGYQFNDYRRCQDIDECSKIICPTCDGMCGVHGTCINTVGAYTCDCDSGYGFVPESGTCEMFTGHPCDDVTCPSNSHCNVINGTRNYECVCDTGFTYDSVQAVCQDINECDQGELCGDHSQCINSVGSYVCECNSGYALDDVSDTCTDIDECTEDDDVCGFGTCVNTDGSYNCNCNSGAKYNATLKTCEDIDECLNMDPSLNCHRCYNAIGTYVCLCNIGWTHSVDFKSCIDFDECSGNHGCSHQCSNTEGSYHCVCPDGYSLSEDKRNCIDIDECTGETECDHTCVNTDGSYECRCNDGYILDSDGHTCILAVGSTCVVNNGGCQQVCDDSGGSIVCSCNLGYTLESDSKSCRKLTCATLPPDIKCKYCFDTNDRYYCFCNSGYTTTEFYKCEDMDECTLGRHTCSHICTNTEGSYTCSCPNGMTLSNDGETCV